MSFNLSTIDTTCKDSSNNEEHIVGDLSYSISFSGYANTDSGLDRVITDIMGRVQSLFEFKTFNSNKYTGNSTITSLSLGASNQDKIAFSGSMQVDGALTEAVA